MAIIKDFLDALRKRLGAGDALPRLSHEQATALFAARYQSFRRLLAANNKALEIMAEIEGALMGDRLFGMSFVRAKAAAATVNVFKLVQALMELGPGRHDRLMERFQELRRELESALPCPDSAAAANAEGGEPVLDFAQARASDARRIGAKMANLAEMRSRLHLAAPDGFAVTVAGYRAFMAHEGLDEELDAMQLDRVEPESQGTLEDLYRRSSAAQNRIIRASPPPELRQAIEEAVARLRERTGHSRFSVRSSAIGEDAAGASFAGQFRSLLNVAPENVVQAFKEVVASKYAPTAIAYRLKKGIPDEDVPMAVGCMAMVDALAGGVAYSRDPLDFTDERIVVNAVWGLPKSVVDGGADMDAYRIERPAGSGKARLASRTIGRKTERFALDPEEGVVRLPVAPELQDAPTLGPADLARLAELAVLLEEAWGGPQDIEWALDAEGRLLLLQCRPLHRLETGQIGHEAVDAPVVERGPALLSGGVTACPGVASGPVAVVRNEAEAIAFPQGGALVVMQSLPKWAALLGRASLVVAEQGGVTGHLASVAREFGVPAVFGMTGALDAVTPGQTITLDASARTLYAGRPGWATESTRQQSALIGSPTHDALKSVAALVTPLTLVDPASPAFRPENCTTLHDVTRYAHELSVREMFEFGERADLPNLTGKRLFCGRPTSWRIINLADGFRRDVPEKCVDLADVASLPMLALWEGFTARPWDGPPAVSGRGMASIIMEAAMNPELEAAGSGFEAENVFIIAREYCCLNVRFGFHFSTVETLAGERTPENFITVKFGGGAADQARKVLRAEMIGELLEARGFAPSVRGDLLLARMESQPHERCLRELRFVGYLLQHTRQLDMVMADRRAAMTWREKLTAAWAELELEDETPDA